MDKDRERYLEKYSWIFQPHLQAVEQNKALQAESDNKLRNMLEGTGARALMFSASDPMSKFIFNPITPALESYSEPFAHTHKLIVKENTRLPDFMKPPVRRVQNSAARPEFLGKRDYFSLSTPHLLGVRDADPLAAAPFNLKQMLGEKEKTGSDAEDEEEDEPQTAGFKPLRFPSPSPSQLDSPLMTWGEVEGEPVKLGPHSQRVAFEENPRERLGHQLANAYLEKGRQKSQKKEAQIQKMLTPYARQFGEGAASGLLSSISSRLAPRSQSSARRSLLLLPTPQGPPK